MARRNIGSGFPVADGSLWDFVWLADGSTPVNKLGLSVSATCGDLASNPGSLVINTTQVLSGLQVNSGAINLTDTNLWDWIYDYGGYMLEIDFVKTQAAANYHSLYDFSHTPPRYGWNFQYESPDWAFGAGYLKSHTSGFAEFDSVSTTELPINQPLRFQAYYNLPEGYVKASIEQQGKTTGFITLNNNTKTWNQSLNGTSTDIVFTFKKSELQATMDRLFGYNDLTMLFECDVNYYVNENTRPDWVKMQFNKMMVDGSTRTFSSPPNGYL